VFRSILTFGQLLEIVLQIAQGVGDSWGGVRREQHLSWSGVIRGPEFVNGGRPESGCLLRISGALIMRSNSAVRATRVKLQEIPQLIIVYEILLQPTSRRFLRELDEAPGENTLHYILQCLHICQCLKSDDRN